jgi:hypothetical protein
MSTGIIRSVRSNLSKIVVTAGAVATVGVGAMLPRPASADTTSTILTAAAVVGGILLLTDGANVQAGPPCAYYNNCPVYYGNPGWRGGRAVYPQYGAGQYGRPDVRSHGDARFNTNDRGNHGR